MPDGPFDQLLDRAASLYGIESDFWDTWGGHHVTPPEAKQAILRAMGVAAGSIEEIESTLAERTRQEWARLAPETVVALESAETELTLHVPARSLNDATRAKLHREDGLVDEYELDLRSLPQTALREVDGETWVRIDARLPVSLPLGYHEISVQCGERSAVTRYIVTPERAWSDPRLSPGRRAAGIAVSLYGIRSQRNWGCGDFRDLAEIIDWVADDLRGSFVALNPLHAIHNRRPFNTSPYLPNCIFYQNLLYLDIEGMQDYALCRKARELRQSAAVETELADLRRAPFVEYERVSALKLRFLKLAFVQLLRGWRHGSARVREFQQYLTREGELLESYSTYCALDEHLHKLDPEVWTWPQWPPAYQDPDSEETRAFCDKHWRRVMFYQYVQWQIDTQLGQAQEHARRRGLSIGLYHDLALATDRFGSDLWAHRPFYVAGCRVGSPPDDFSPRGQDWAFPPPNADRHRQNGYRLFAESIRKNCRHGGALRIDHVMRLFRLYWIPDGCDATQGAYVRERSQDFLRVLALESVRNQVTIVGEDLGTVQPEVRETLARYGILSYRLLYFEKRENGEFLRSDEYPEHALVSSTTHDLPTLAGFWTGVDIEARRKADILDEQGYASQVAARALDKQKMLDVLFEMGLLRPDLPRSAGEYPELTGELHQALIGFLAKTPCELLAINQEDLTKELEQQNLPGTTWQYPNWGRKMRFTVEELRASNEARDLTAMVRDWIVSSGRENRYP